MLADTYDSILPLSVSLDLHGNMYQNLRCFQEERYY